MNKLSSQMLASFITPTSSPSRRESYRVRESDATANERRASRKAKKELPGDA
jgi:hypothetical protein